MPHFGRTAIFNGDNVISIPYGGKPVGDNEAGSPGHERYHSLPDMYLVRVSTLEVALSEAQHGQSRRQDRLNIAG